MKQDQVSIAIRESFGQRVRTLREAQGLSQHRFSDMISMDRSYLIDIEKGRRNISIDNLFKIAHGFGIPLSALFEGVDDFVYEHIMLPK